MGLFDKLFGKKGEDEQKKAQEAARERGNQLLSGLNTAMAKAIAQGDSPDGAISTDKMFVYHEQIASLDSYLKAQPALRLDTADIDKKLSEIAEQVEKAVESDMPRTLEEGVTALTRGILAGRADIDESERAKMLDMIDKRLELLKALKIAVEAAANIDHSRNKLRQARDLLAKTQAELGVLDDELETFPDGRSLVGLERDPANEEEREFLRRQSRRANLTAQINGAEQDVVTLEDTIDTSELNIEQAELSYLTLSSQLGKDISEEIRQMAAHTRKAISENENKLRSLNQATNELNALFATWKEPDFIRQKKVAAKLALDEADAKKRKIERAAAAAEARKIREENARQLAEQAVQTQTARQTITN